MQKVKVKLVSFGIPNTATFPEEYRGGYVEVGVWPPVGLEQPVLNQKGGLERLEKWAVNSIVLGLIEGDHSEAELREDRILIKILSSKGTVLLDTFIREDRYEYERLLPDA